MTTDLSLSQIADLTRFLYAFYALIVAAEQLSLTSKWTKAWNVEKSWGRLVFILQIFLSVGLALSDHWLWPLSLLALAAIQGVWWRGTYNGGSDMMGFTVLLSLGFYSLPLEGPGLKKLALAYLGTQAFLSYVIAGVIKVKQPEWRSGVALKAFLSSNIYPAPSLLMKPGIAFFVSWTVMIFELLFPFIFIIDGLVYPLIAIALAFHLINAWIFGLNRFTFAWAASWPALIYITTLI